MPMCWGVAEKRHEAQGKKTTGRWRTTHAYSSLRRSFGKGLRQPTAIQAPGKRGASPLRKPTPNLFPWVPRAVGDFGSYSQPREQGAANGGGEGTHVWRSVRRGWGSGTPGWNGGQAGGVQTEVVRKPGGGIKARDGARAARLAGPGGGGGHPKQRGTLVGSRGLDFGAGSGPGPGGWVGGTDDRRGTPRAACGEWELGGRGSGDGGWARGAWTRAEGVKTAANRGDRLAPPVPLTGRLGRWPVRQIGGGAFAVCGRLVSRWDGGQAVLAGGPRAGDVGVAHRDGFGLGPGCRRGFRGPGAGAICTWDPRMLAGGPNPGPARSGLEGSLYGGHHRPVSRRWRKCRAECTPRWQRSTCSDSQGPVRPGWTALQAAFSR